MADLTKKQREIVEYMVNISTDLDDLVGDIDLLIKKYYQSGTVTSDVLLSSEMIKHLDDIDIPNIITLFESFIVWLDSENRRDIILKARR